MLLKLKSDYPKLNKLVHDLLNIDPARPEVFVALSVLWERKDEKKALQYAEQVRILFDADWAELLYLLYYCLQLSDYFAIRVFGSMRGTYQGI